MVCAHYYDCRLEEVGSGSGEKPLPVLFYYSGLSEQYVYARGNDSDLDIYDLGSLEGMCKRQYADIILCV